MPKIREQKSVAQLIWELNQMGPTLWEQKEFHKNPIVCSIGRELKPGTDDEYIIHDYINKVILICHQCLCGCLA